MRAWTPLWSRILQEMTPIFFEHPDKLNLVMLEGGQRDSQLHGTSRRDFMSPTKQISCYQNQTLGRKTIYYIVILKNLVIIKNYFVDKKMSHL